MCLGRQKLEYYLRENEISQAGFASGAGLQRSEIHNLITGYRGATLRTAVAIERATRGRIMPADWLEPEPVEMHGR